jgi:hypothetical protein
MSKVNLTTKIKCGVNSVLEFVGLELITTRKTNAEAARLEQLRATNHWKSPRYTQGLNFDPESQLKFISDTLFPYKEDYLSFKLNGNTDDKTFFLNNGYFGSVDAEVLYCMIRHNKPRRILEVGSGNSTRLMRQAIREGQLKTRLTCIDPCPRIEMKDYADEYIKASLENQEAMKFISELGENDILFIDSSHTVMTGGDVNYLFLEAIPQLRRGVFIHIHDIFLPFDYPERWIIKERWGWTEQYLVHAFLYANDAFKITWAARYMWEYYRPEIQYVIPGCTTGTVPSSLWLRKVA